MNIYLLNNMIWIIIYSYSNIFVFCEAAAHGVRHDTICWTCVFKLSNKHTTFEMVWWPDTWLLSTNKSYKPIQKLLLHSVYSFPLCCLCNIWVPYSSFKNESKCESNYEILALHAGNESSGIKWPELSMAGLEAPIFSLDLQLPAFTPGLYK